MITSNTKTNAQSKVGTPAKNFSRTSSIVWNLKRRYR